MSPSLRDRWDPGWPPLRPDLSPDKAELARRCMHDDEPYPPGWCAFTDRDAWHRYSVAYHSGWLSPVPPVVRAAAAAVLRDPANREAWSDFVRLHDAAKADSRNATLARAAEPAHALTSTNADRAGLLSAYTRGTGVARLSASARLSARPETVSLLENIARLVIAAGGRRDLSAADWADRCGITSAQLSKLLTDEAPRWGLAVHRYRAGKARTHMIMIEIGQDPGHQAAAPPSEGE